MRKGLGRHNRRSAGGPQPSLVLDFAGTGTLDPRVTFTRSTTGTYYNSSGVLTTAAINEARFDYNPSTLAPLGLLIEQSSTNLLNYSQTFSNAAWNKIVTVTPNTIIAPDGTLSANSLTSVVINDLQFVYQNTNFASPTTSALSVYMKSNGRQWGWIYMGSLANATAYFDLTNGIVGIVSGTGSPTAQIFSVGNGWYRCTLVASAPSGVNGYGFGVASANGTNRWTGDGYSGIYAWGAQLEALAFPTSYIKTDNAQVIRASDNASMTGTNFSSWFNQGQGTLYCESWFLSPASGYPSPYSINDGTNSNRIQAYVNNSLTSLGGDITLGLVSQANVLATVPSMTSYVKSAFSFQSKVVNFAGAGVAGTTNTTANIPNGLNKLSIGTNAFGNAFSIYIKKFAYYPQPVTSAQNQALTGS